MDLLNEITLTGDYFQRPQAPAVDFKPIELSLVEQQHYQGRLGDEKITALLAERQVLYREESLRGTKNPNQDVVMISPLAEGWHVSVADGVGGLPQGDKAATQALRYLHHHFPRHFSAAALASMDQTEMRQRLGELLQRAHSHVNRLYQSALPLRRMRGETGATTVVGAFRLNAHEVVVYNVGDSGMALVPADTTQPLQYTPLHSTYEEWLLQQGGSRRRLNQDFCKDAAGQLQRDMITSALGGGQKHLRAAFISRIRVQPGDQLFLFTDGLLKTVGKTTMATSARDLRMSEYGRPSSLLEFLAQPNQKLHPLLDSQFREQHQGPSALLDDIALVRIEIAPQRARRQVAAQPRPLAYAMAEIVA